MANVRTFKTSNGCVASVASVLAPAAEPACIVVRGSDVRSATLTVNSCDSTHHNSLLALRLKAS
jgi:hypothetical protein